MKKPKEYGITFIGGINDGKILDGLKNAVTVDDYKKTDQLKDGRIVYEAILPRPTR